MGIEQVQQEIEKFAVERDWSQFHTVRNLILAIQAEVGELAELVQWIPDGEIDGGWLDANRERFSEEWADVFIYLLRLAQVADIEPVSAALNKIRNNDEKYPVEKAKGTAKKYTDL